MGAIDGQPWISANIATVAQDWTRYKTIDQLFPDRSPVERRNRERQMLVWRFEQRLADLIRWPRWPVLNVVWLFWTNLMEEGVRDTCKPRWGALTFSYLNDGIRPTLYHTVLSVLRCDTYLWPHGAPRNAKEAAAALSGNPETESER